MRKFKFMDPSQIMVIVVSVIILAVGVFAFFTVAGQVKTNMESLVWADEITPSATTTNASNQSYYAARNETAALSNNLTGTGNSVFNIVGIVLIIGAIMTIVGLVYSYVKPGGY